jgi:HPt (histidine-containing phosphotransfer) domain-containing protein
VGDNENLLREIAAVFLEDRPRMLGEVRAAIEQGDALRLKRALHSLQGTLSNFGAAPAVAATRRLETLAEVNEPSGMEEAYQTLEQEIQQLEQALAALALPLAST